MSRIEIYAIALGGLLLAALAAGMYERHAQSLFCCLIQPTEPTQSFHTIVGMELAILFRSLYCLMGRTTSPWGSFRV
jgi:hypothetical protein